MTAVDDVYAVSLAGDIDMSRQSELRDLLTGFRRSTAANAWVDLTAVTFLDSTGLSALVELHQVAAARRGQVTLTNPADIVLKVLQVTGLTPQFQIVGPSPARPRLPAQMDG